VCSARRAQRRAAPNLSNQPNAMQHCARPRSQSSGAIPRRPTPRSGHESSMARRRWRAWLILDTRNAVVAIGLGQEMRSCREWETLETKPKARMPSRQQAASHLTLLSWPGRRGVGRNTSIARIARFTFSSQKQSCHTAPSVLASQVVRRCCDTRRALIS